MIDSLFPFSLPGATALYLSLYVLTLCVHVVLMSYVLAGSGYVAGAALAGRGRTDPGAAILRDWLPFGLGAAITAGVAPLLFVQILYQHSFYTANLLLFYRWMAVVPVLIVGFYLLYLAKARQGASRSALTAAAVLAFLCFAFTGYSWTENHLLSLDRGAWVGLYQAKQVVYASPAIGPRMLMWFAGSVPLMAMILCWQLRYQARRAGAGDDAALPPLVRRLAVLALVGLSVAAIAGVAYARMLGTLERMALTSAAARPYLLLAAGGMVVQGGGWLWLWRMRRVAGAGGRRALAVVTAGALLAVLGTAVVREVIRLGVHEPGALAQMHARAARVGGMPVFLFFLVVNAGLIAWCIRSARRGLVAEAPSGEPGNDQPAGRDPAG